MQTVYQAHAALKQAQQLFCSNYCAKATSQQKESKYWTGGVEEFYESKEQGAVINSFGYENIRAYHRALECTPEYMAYDRFHKIMHMLEYNSNEYKSLVKAMKAAGLWNEEDQHMNGVQLLALATTHAPKHAQLLGLYDELNLEIPHRWDHK